MKNNVIVLYPERTIHNMEKTPDGEAAWYRLQRRYARWIASAEAVTTCLIGLGFLFCIGLTISML